MRESWGMLLGQVNNSCFLSPVLNTIKDLKRLLIQVGWNLLWYNCVTKIIVLCSIYRKYGRRADLNDGSEVTAQKHQIFIFVAFLYVCLIRISWVHLVDLSWKTESDLLWILYNCNVVWDINCVDYLCSLYNVSSVILRSNHRNIFDEESLMSSSYDDVKLFFYLLWSVSEIVVQNTP